MALPECPWKYLRFIKDMDDKWTPAAGTFEGWPKKAKELKCLDPCMGSGHFVVAMFERIVALRMAEEGLGEPDSVAAVIRDNLFGLEIDPRCTQISAFNVALAAWRRVGHCKLPAMNLACSGLAPNTSEANWLAIAGDNEKLQKGMERLYRLFKDAPMLGSLINPRQRADDMYVADYRELQPLLERVLTQEAKDDTAHEMAVTARGLAKAANILASQFTLVATNVPYLGRGKQVEVLQDYCARQEESLVASQYITQTPSAYGFSLLIKGLLESGVTRAPEQEIVSANQNRFTYREFAERVGRLASGLASLGVKRGDTVAIMDWDTHRYLECFFAVPMMGAVLHTVNVRLSAEQILYTINHAEDDVILINNELLPLLQQIWDRVDAGKRLVLLNDTGKATQTVQTSLSFDAEYEALLATADPRRDFPELDESTRATCSTRPEPPGSRRASTSVTGSWCCTRYRPEPPWLQSGTVGLTMETSTCPSRRCSMFTPGATRTSRPCWA
jgi:AMP-binding enzyme